MKTKHIGLVALAAVAVCTQGVMAQEWGTIKGRFVIDGAAPQAPELDITKDRGFCGPKTPDPTIQVGKDGGVANVALWLYVDRGGKAPEPHPAYAEKIKQPVKVTNEMCIYVPHVATVVAGQPVEFVNKDPIPHNFKVEGFANASFNNLVPINGVFNHTFASEERYPMNASCSIHPWMSAKLVVRESPYMAATAEDGTFVIENLPVGKHKFQIWHEVPGNLKGVEVAGEEADRRGTVEIEVKAGENDLGDIKIKAATLKK